MGLLGKILKAYMLLLYWRISLNGSVVQLLRESLFSAGPPWRKLIRVISTGPNFQETLKLLSSGQWLGLAASLEEASSFSADSRKDLELLWYFLSSCSCKEGDLRLFLIVIFSVIFHLQKRWQKEAKWGMTVLSSLRDGRWDSSGQTGSCHYSRLCDEDYGRLSYHIIFFFF